jgi:Zn ribbon nucleic-acid-binding protein
VQAVYNTGTQREVAPEQGAIRPGMSPAQPPNFSNPASRASMQKQCRHLRVQIVAREEDSEFVECVDCGDIFESSEFKDMAIEEATTDDEA